ncbi:MAG: hypothetical protein H5U11_13995, partial [Rhizobium sp.]|nr:hypothetical protein [Rhizobium sp.]
MFKLVDSLTAWWPVKVLQPDPDKPGKMKEFEFEIEFEIIDRDETKRMDEQRAELIKQAEADPSEATLRRVQDALEEVNLASFRRVIRNWRGIVDEQDRPISFTEESFVVAMKHNRIRAGLNKAYQEASGQEGVRL